MLRKTNDKKTGSDGYRFCKAWTVNLAVISVRSVRGRLLRTMGGDTGLWLCLAFPCVIKWGNTCPAVLRLMSCGFGGSVIRRRNAGLDRLAIFL